MKIMLDTQIYDLIIDTQGMAERLNQLSEENKLTILCTHIQEHELANIPDEQRKANIAQITRKIVPTSGGVIGVSRIGLATIGDGGIGGVRIGDIRSPSGSHVHDALIATTAARDADVLVTEDKRLANRMQTFQTTCTVWGFSQFKEYVFQ
jgi:predicted nucleic acid-binding protein